MSKFYVVVLLVFFCSTVNAQIFDVDWMKNIGGVLDDAATDITTDKDKNIYLTGFFESTLNYQSLSLTSMGERDGFVMKLDSLGNVIWGHRFGGAGYDNGHSISVDASDNVYIAGKYENYMNIAGGIKISFDDENHFVAKFDNSGNYQWTVDISNYSNGGYRTYSLETSNGDDVYVSAYYQSPFSFFDTTFVNSAGGGSYIAKLRSDGSLKWVRSIGGAGEDLHYSDGYIYATGEASDSAYFGPTLHVSPSETISNYYVSKIDGDGQFIWTEFAYEYGSAIYVEAPSITVDNENSIYVTGNYYGRLSVNGESLYSNYIWGPCSEIDSNGFTVYYPDSSCKYYNKDFYIVKYDESGNLGWAKTFNGTNANDSYEIVAVNEQVLVTGSFFGTLEIDGQSVTNNFHDFYLASFNKSGYLNWITQSSGNNVEFISSLAAVENTLYATGNFVDTMIFANNSLSSSSERDVVLLKLDLTGSCIMPLEGEFTIYPVPSTKFISFQIDMPASTSYNIEIFNASGQKIPIEVTCTRWMQTINIEDLKEAVYFLRLYNDSFSYVGKFVKI